MTKTVTQAVEQLVGATVGMSDADMGREWKWGVYDEEGLRFALLMTHHEVRRRRRTVSSRSTTRPIAISREWSRACALKIWIGRRPRVSGRCERRSFT